MKEYLGSLIRRKDLIVYLVTSGLKAQNKNSFLGYFWWLLDPFLGVLIYYFVVVIVFQRGEGENYGVFLVTGMIVWRWLSSTVSFSSRSVLVQANIIKQVALPKIIFPISATLTQVVNFGFGLVVIGIFLFAAKIIPGSMIIWLPYITVMQLTFMLAIAFFLASLCIFIRDIDNILNHFMRLWFFGSPVIWTENMLPDKISWLLNLNPMTHFLRAYRNVLIHNAEPDFMMLLYIGITSTALVGIMVYYYSKYEHKIIKAF